MRLSLGAFVIKAACLIKLITSFPADTSTSIVRSLTNGNELSGFIDKSWFNQGSIKKYLESYSLPTPTLEKFYDDENFVKVETFLAIPYAEVMEKRFEKPKVHNSQWEGQRDATKIRSRCMQPRMPLLELFEGATHEGFEQFSEDCLTLNIYKPIYEENENLPVYFWVHGGGFSMGSGYEYDSALIASMHKIIVVTINYRLGIFGFYSNNNGLKGNYGLWDQVAALEWVNREISNFGGDKNQITIAGESAGGGSVSALVYFDALRTNGLVGLPLSDDEKRPPLFKTANPSSGVLGTRWGYKMPWQADKRHARLHTELLTATVEQKIDETEAEFKFNVGQSSKEEEETEADENQELPERIYKDYTAESINEPAIEAILRGLSSKDLHNLGTKLSLDFVDIYEGIFWDAPTYDDDFFVGYDYLKTALKKADREDQKTFESYTKKQLYLYIDLTGYNINYGLLNGEGTFLLMNPYDREKSFNHLLEDITISSMMRQILTDKHRNCKLFSCSKACTEFDQAKADFSTLVEGGRSFSKGFNKEKYSSYLENFKTAMDFIKFHYQHENQNYETATGGSSEAWCEQQKKITMYGDYNFNFPAVTDMVNAKRNGAKVDAMFIKRGSDFNLIFQHSIKNFSNAGYGFHGDDIGLLFGLWFCNDEFDKNVSDGGYDMHMCLVPSPVDAETGKPTGEAYEPSIEELTASISNMLYYFRNDKGDSHPQSTSNQSSFEDSTSLPFTEIGQSGDATRKANLYSAAIKFYEQILDSVFDDGSFFVEESENDDNQQKTRDEL